jgi:hypothetical protein
MNLVLADAGTIACGTFTLHSVPPEMSQFEWGLPGVINTEDNTFRVRCPAVPSIHIQNVGQSPLKDFGRCPVT